MTETPVAKKRGRPRKTPVKAATYSKPIEDDRIEVIVLKRLGCGDGTHANPGDKVKIKRELARKFQDNGAIKIVL